MIISIYIYIAGKRCTAVNYCKMLKKECGVLQVKQPRGGPKKCSPPNGGRRQASLFQEKTHGIHLNKFVASLVEISPTDSGNAIPWGYSISNIDMEVSPSFLPYSYKMEFL